MRNDSFTLGQAAVKRFHTKTLSTPVTMSYKAVAQTSEENKPRYMLEADNITYFGEEIDRLYLGEDMLWEKATTPSIHSISGVWADSTQSDSKNGEPFVYYNGKYADNVNYNPADNTFWVDIEEDVTSAKQMFTNVTRNGNAMSLLTNPNLTAVDISGLDFSNVVSTEQMFLHCLNLTEIKGFDTIDVSKLKNVSDMFNDCSNLTEVDISKFNATSIEQCNNMFTRCTSLKKVSLPTSPMIEKINGGGMGGIFYDCQNLEIITNFNVESTLKSQSQNTRLKSKKIF